MIQWGEWLQTRFEGDHLAAPAEVAALVSRLAKDEHGLLLLANALDSVSEALVAADLVRNLLHDVAEEIAAAPPGDRWPDAVARVCGGKTPKSRRPGGYLRASTPVSGAPHAVSRWTTVMKASVWQSRHLAPKKGSAPLPPFPPVKDARFTARFRAKVAEPDWFQPPTPTDGAWLGRPASAGANCWVSCVELDSTHPVSAGDLGGSARRIVEALGLLPDSPFDAYVRYTIDAAVATTAGPGMTGGLRPTFADQGNEWFRVTTPTPRAIHYRSSGWGATVNLAACRARVADDTGRPERVSQSIPVSARSVRDIEVLFPRESDQRFTERPAVTFRDTLLRGRSAADIEQAIVELWNAATPGSP